MEDVRKQGYSYIIAAKKGGVASFLPYLDYLLLKSLHA